MVFSGVCCNKKNGGEKGLKHRNAHQMEADSGHYLSLSAVLLLYPLGLTADSCWYSSWIFSAWSNHSVTDLQCHQQIQWYFVQCGQPYEGLSHILLWNHYYFFHLKGCAQLWTWSHYLETEQLAETAYWQMNSLANSINIDLISPQLGDPESGRTANLESLTGNSDKDIELMVISLRFKSTACWLMVQWSRTCLTIHCQTYSLKLNITQSFCLSLKVPAISTQAREYPDLSRYSIGQTMPQIVRTKLLSSP